MRRAVLALLLVIPLTAIASSSAHPARPTNRDQPLTDGCQRPSFADIVLVNSPEWVYVNRDASVHFAQGITRVPHPTPVDEPGTHTWFDFNGNLVPDKKYRYFIAGSKSAGTNNYSGATGESAEEYGRLHYEWEEGSMPKWVWPADGDWTQLYGSWIWDCGHWTTDGVVTGERTEFHPLSGIAVTRKNSWHAKAGEIETDAFVSSTGTGAHATEQCTLMLHPQPNKTYGPGFFGCARDPANFRQKLAASYTFTLPAPKRPAGATVLELRSTAKVRLGRGAVKVKPAGDAFKVTVRPHSRNFVWGKSYFVRWKAKSPPVTKLKVKLQDLLIRQADPDPSEGGVDPAGEKWALYLELNGYWKLVDDWARSLFAAKDNMLIHLNRTIKVTVPKGKPVQLFMMGRECDGPSGVTLFGHFVPNTKPCPFNTTESKITSHNNDDPGTVLINYKSAKAALGKHTAKSRPTVVFPHTGPISFFNGIQGNDDYELTYKVSRG